MATIKGINGNDTLIGTAGNDIIKSLNGNDTVYGDYDTDQTLPTATNGHIDVTADGSVIGSIVLSETDDAQFHFGSNAITGGTGNDTFYGNLPNLTVAVAGGNADATVSANAQQVSITDDISNHVFFGDNVIQSGLGHDTFYGNMNTFTLHATTTVSDAFVDGSDSTLTMHMNTASTVYIGSNALIAGNGGNVFYGNMNTFNIDVTNSDMNAFVNGNNDHLDMTSSLTNIVNFDTNLLISGNGNDILYGNMNTLQMPVIAGQVNAFITPLDSTNSGDAHVTEVTASSIHFDENLLFGGGGNDVMYGNLNSLSSPVTSADTNAFITGDNEISTTSNHVSSGFLFESNLLDGGSGNDTMYGNMNNAQVAITGATVNAFVNTFDPNNIGTVNADNITSNCMNFSCNGLWGGAGNDTMYGNMNTLSLTVTGSDANVFVSADNETIHVTDSVSNQVHFGSNLLDGGNGDNVLYGNINDFTLAITGGNLSSNISAMATANNGTIIDSTSSDLCFGCNLLYSGSGNDTLYGNMHSLNFSISAGLTDVMFSENNPPFTAIDSTSSHIQFGDNLLYAGNGTNTLFGNMQSLQINPGSSDVSTMNFGDNLLIGGSGHDTLVASVQSYTLASNTVTASTSGQHVSIQDASGNTIQWGNSELSGGGGSDTFVFALANTADNHFVMQGNDVITDFNNSADASGDVLQFGQYTDAAALGDHVTIAHTSHYAGGGCGGYGNTITDSVIQFDGGGSITLLGLDIASLNDIHHVDIV